MSSDGYLSDAATRHQVHVQRYAGGSLKRLAKFITKAISTAKSRVSEGLSRYGTQRYEKQIQELQGELAGVYGEMKQQAVLDLTEFGGYEAEFNMTLLGKVVKTVVQLNRPSIEQVAAAALADPLDLEVGKGRQRISINGALDQYGTKKSAEIISEIRMGSALGETSGQISRRLTSLGVQQRDQAHALVNTMTNHIATTARVEVLKDNDDILKGMRRIATLDSRTTLFCMSIDQTIIPLDGPKPPYHWRCRTTLIPVLKDEFAREVPGSTRPAIGPNGVEQVSSKTSYGEWLARQPASFQKDVLGPARYELFSKGELTLDKFVDDNGKTLTLQQLRQREAVTFRQPTGEFTVYDIGYPIRKPDVSTPARRAAVEIENRIRGDALETGAFIGDDGSILLQRQGQPDRVGFPESEFGKLRGTTFTHNHPGNSPFSIEDVELASYIGLHELRAVGPTLRYTMVAEKGWPSGEVVDKLSDQVEQEAIKRVYDLVNRGELEREHTQSEAEHQFWSILSGRVGLKYSRERS